MFKVSLTLPVEKNDGTSNRAVIAQIKKQMCLLYHGFSAQTIEGGWIDEETGIYYEDTSILIWTFADTQEAVNDLYDLAALWCDDLEQIELLLTVESDVTVAYLVGSQRLAVA